MDDARTVWCGNLSDQVTEELLFELFLQAAPLERVRIPTDREGRKSNFAFITFKHDVSVNYAQQLLNGTYLFDKPIIVKPRNNNSNNSQNQVGERNAQHNDYQRQHFNQNSYNDVLKTGQMVNHNYEQMQMNSFDDRPGRWEHNSYRENFRDREDRHRNNHKSYKKHDYQDNRQNDSPNRRRNNYMDRRNFNDRNNRRNHRKPYY